jgi:hypothetical protein
MSCIAGPITRRDVLGREAAPSHLLLIVAATAFLVGLAIRLWIYTTGPGEINSDEAVMGLMARHLWNGEWSTFFWGQAYGGIVEVVLLSPVVALLGATDAALQVVPFLQSVIATALVFLVGRRVLGLPGAITAAALFWSFPPASVWWQTRQGLLYLPIVIVGLSLVLIALRIEENPERRWAWLVFGFAAGLGWWISPQILYFLMPVTAWLMLKRVLPHGYSILGLVAGFVIGAGPWIVTNIAQGWPSLSIPPVSGTPADRLWAFSSGGLPMALGLRIPFTERWILPPLGQLLFIGGIAALAVVLTRRRSSISIHHYVLLAFPVLFALIPAAPYVGSGRYFFFLAPSIALSLASLPWNDLGRALVIGVASLLTMFGFYQIRSLPVAFVPDLDPLVAALDENDIEHVVGGYWLAYKLSWETEERIIADAPALSRYRPYADRVKAADSVAFVYNLYETTQKANAEALRQTLNAW